MAILCRDREFLPLAASANRRQLRLHAAEFDGRWVTEQRS
jgi:hypothetical protein